MNKNISKKLILLGMLLFATAPLWAQSASVAPTFTSAVSDIRAIAAAAGGLVGGLVALIGIGRTAYKLANGDTDAMTSLIMAVVGIFLGFLATTFVS